LDIVCSILEENSRPPSFPASLRMYVLRLLLRDKTIEFRSIDCLIFFKKYCTAENFFLQICRSIWIPKTENFTLIPNPKSKLKKTLNQKFFSKNCPFASFFKINLYLCTFSQFCLQIWNKNKILSILVPILTYFNTKYFVLNTAQHFFSSNTVGQYGYQKTLNFMLIPNLKMKLRKSALIKSYFF